uniref:Transmembrane protein n=1 Tax=Meloidogyne hapla TaxID=6305 RepID=A0A1I8C0B0_MELHA
MQHKKVGFSSFPVQIPYPLSSIPLPLISNFSSNSSFPLPTSSLSLPNSSLSLPNSSLLRQYSSIQLPPLIKSNKEADVKETSRKRRRSSFSCDGTKKLIPFTEVEWKYVQRKFMNEDQHTLMELTNIMNMWLDRMWHDTPVFISISELVLRALVLDQKRHSSKGSVGLDNADVGLILGSVIIRFGFLFFLNLIFVG